MYVKHESLQKIPKKGNDIVESALCIRRTRTRMADADFVYSADSCRRKDWYTNGHFCCFDCFLTVFDDWYTIGTVLVDLWRLVHQTPIWSFLLFWLFWLFLTIGTFVYLSSRVYQDCTNSVPIVKNSQKQPKQQKWPLVYQSSHVYTESAEYTKSTSATARVRRIHKAVESKGIDTIMQINWNTDISIKGECYWQIMQIGWHSKVINEENYIQNCSKRKLFMQWQGSPSTFRMKLSGFSATFPDYAASSLPPSNSTTYCGLFLWLAYRHYNLGLYAYTQALSI